MAIKLDHNEHFRNISEDAKSIIPQSHRKRSANMAFEADRPEDSAFSPLFEACKVELDGHYDRRERIVKASRDITAAGKKIIFALQRLKSLGLPVPAHIRKQNQQHHETISKAYASIASDLQGLNAHHYSRTITGGTQELIEAISFEHYLETQTLISFQQTVDKITTLGGPQTPIPVTEGDYVLGIYDMSGELMRFAITTMAVTGEVPPSISQNDESGKRRNVLDDLRELRALLQGLNGSSGWSKDASKKMEVLQTCVEKVENALYGLVVRGAERPKGWLPDERMRAPETELEVV